MEPEHGAGSGDSATVKAAKAPAFSFELGAVGWICGARGRGTYDPDVGAGVLA